MKAETRKYLKIALAVLLLYLCIHYWDGIVSIVLVLLGAASPLLIGALIAYVLNILMGAYERLFFPKCQKKAVKKLI